MTPRRPAAGDACTADSSCPSGGVCATGWPGGYCTQDCQTASCPSGSVCVAVTGGSVCLTSCPEPGAQSTCRDAYSCAALKSGGGVCAPAQ